MAKVDVNRKVLSLGQEQLQKNLIKWQDHVQEDEGSLESAFRAYSSAPWHVGLPHVSTKVGIEVSRGRVDVSKHLKCFFTPPSCCPAPLVHYAWRSY